MDYSKEMIDHEPIIFIQTEPKKELNNLIKNPPSGLLETNLQFVLWLDKIKTEVAKLK